MKKAIFLSFLVFALAVAPVAVQANVFDNLYQQLLLLQQVLAIMVSQETVATTTPNPVALSSSTTSAERTTSNTLTLSEANAPDQNIVNPVGPSVFRSVVSGYSLSYPTSLEATRDVVFPFYGDEDLQLSFMPEVLSASGVESAYIFAKSSIGVERSSCLSSATVGSSNEVVLNGVTFNRDVINTTAKGADYQTTKYVTWRNDICYQVALATSLPVGNNTGLLSALDQVVATFSFN